MGQSIAQSEEIDSLRVLLNDAKVDSVKMKKYREIHIAYLNHSVDTAKLFLDSALTLSQRKGSNDQLLKGLGLLSIYWFERGEIDSALLSTKKAVEIFTDNSELRADALLHRGWALFENGNYDEATGYFLECLKIAEEIGSHSTLISALSNLGSVFLQMEDMEKSIRYYSEAIDKSKETGDQYMEAVSTANLGLAYKINEEYDKALELYLKANDFFDKMGEKYRLAINLQNIGYIYLAKKDYAKAGDYFAQSGEISNEIDDLRGVTQSLVNYARMEKELKNYSKSENLYDSALIMAKEKDFKYTLKMIYLGLTDLYERQGDYQNAYQTQLLYEEVKDSLLNDSYLEKISDLEARYEFEKKQNEILALSEENLIKQASIETKNFWIRLLFVAVFFILCTGVLSVVMVRQRMRYKNKEMIFEAVSRTEIKEQQRIARDLHDSIGAMLAIVKNKISGIDQKNINEETRNELQEVATLVNKTSEETRRISHNMIPEDLLKFGLVSATESLMENLKSNAKVNMECSHFGMEERLDQVKELNIFRIIQELIQNSLKHADPRNININFTRHKEYLNIIMQDDGKGFPGTETKSGMGLANVQSRLNFLKAKWQVDSSQSAGTSFVLDIPVRS